MSKRRLNMKFLFFIVIVTIGLLQLTVPNKSSARVWVESRQNDIIYLYRDYNALLIGIGNYTYLPKLPNAVRDLEEVARELEKLGFQVQILKDPASKELREILRGLPYNMGSVEDRALLIYFAGHGFTETLADKNKLGYLVPSDSPLPTDNPSDFAVKGISMSEIVELAERLKNRHVLMVFDSCFSGSVFNIMRAVPRNITEKIGLPVRQFITAGTENEEVPDKSIFKQVLLQGIRGEADSDSDGFITGTELGMYLEKQVSQYTNAQHPQFGKIKNPVLDKGDFVFIVPGQNTIMPEPPNTGSGIVKPNSERWYIYQDADSIANHGEWTNWMAEKEPGKMMELSFVDKTNPASGLTAIRVKVNFQHSSWGGIAVASLPNYWGEKPNNFAYDLSQAERLVFHARGETGGEMIQIKVAIAGDKPYGDSVSAPAATNWISLTREWETYELLLRGYDLRRVITPFAFVTDKAHNEEDAITFYLDDIYFEME